MDDMDINRRANGNTNGNGNKSEEEGPEPTTEDEYEDFSRSAGRYARGRRKGLGFTEVE